MGRGQDCRDFVMNNNLELVENLPNPIPFFNGSPGGTISFQVPWVPSWNASHGSPHHIIIDPNTPSLFNPCDLYWSQQSGNEFSVLLEENVFIKI